MKYVLGIAFSLLFLGTAFGEIVSVAENTACLRSSPTPQGSYVVMQAPRYYPLSVESSNGDFFEVTDYQKRKGWIQKSAVGPTRGVVVKNATVNVRTGPGTNHDIAFKALEGVAFEVLEDRDGWLQVRHESGGEGWIYKSLTWGP